MENINRYKITFDFAFIDQIDNLLKNIKILQKSFSKNVTYFIDLKEEIEEQVLYALYQITLHGVKIEKMNIEDDEYEVGTDKPLGSKSAIDEN